MHMEHGIPPRIPKMETPVIETYESFFCSVIFGCKWEQALRMRRSWKYQNGLYMIGVLQSTAMLRRHRIVRIE
jgi:hypothetical protein